jgi:hypothetical protein
MRGEERRGVSMGIWKCEVRCVDHHVRFNKQQMGGVCFPRVKEGT